MTEALNALPDKKMQECSVFLTCAYEALLL